MAQRIEGSLVVWLAPRATTKRSLTRDAAGGSIEGEGTLTTRNHAMKIAQSPKPLAELSDASFSECVEGSYSFEELTAEGVLIKVTSWVTREMGFVDGRYRVQVAMTARLWSLLHRFPEELSFFQTVRGRGHDVLWLAAWALRRARRHGMEQVKYLACLPTGEVEEDAKLLHATVGHSEDGRSHVIIGLPEEFPIA